MIILAGTDYICFLYEDNNIMTHVSERKKLCLSASISVVLMFVFV